MSNHEASAVEAMLLRTATDAGYDEDRMRGLIVHAIETHPDQATVFEYLRAGASFYARRTSEGDIEVALKITEDAELIAAMRADVWGDEPQTAKPQHRATALGLVRVPASVVTQKPQG